MSEKKQKPENIKPQNSKKGKWYKKQSWTVPNIPPIARPIPQTPVQDNPTPESPKPEYQPQTSKPVDTPKPQTDKPEK